MKRMIGTLPGLQGAALCLAALIASCIPTRKDEDQAGSGTELGNVVGSLYTPGNLPAAGVTVTLYPADPEKAAVKTAVTNADGEYAFKGVNGDYSLYALDGDGNGLRVDSIAADTAKPIDLERLQLAPVASISGHAKVIGVRSTVTGAPQVEMYLARSPFRLHVEPNSDFLWPELPAGKYWLSLFYSWSKAYTVPITLVSGETLDLDTVTLINEFSAGISRRDTLKVSSSQLPLHFGDKLATSIGAVDSVFWVLNGVKVTQNQQDRYMDFELKAGDLTDTGYNILEMRLYLQDTTVIRAWYIDLDDSPVVPWARHAVKGIFLGSEENPRPNSIGGKLGTFRILARRVLSDAELSLLTGDPVPGGDTALPDTIKVPMSRWDLDIPRRCGDLTYAMEPDLFPGDTVTFLTAPDEFWGGITHRFRKDEDYAHFANLAWLDGVSWPQADLYPKSKGGSIDYRLEPGSLVIKLERNHRGNGGSEDCTPLSRGFTLGPDGIPNEFVAMPAGMSSGNLLLHFRAGLPKGLYTEALAASGDYVFLDSAGRGVAGSGTDRREVQLSAAEVSELKALLAPLPDVVPIEWDKDYLEDTSAVPQTTNFLLSGGRGALLAGAPRSRPVPEAKLNLFQAVEAWLRSHDLL